MPNFFEIEVTVRHALSPSSSGCAIVSWGSSGGEVPAAKRSALVMPPSLQAGIHDVSHQESDVARPARTWEYGADVRATAPAGGVVVVEYPALGIYVGGH